MKDVLPFVSLINYIDFLLELQRDTPKVLCGIFEKLVTIHEYNKGAIALTVALQMRPCTNHTAIKYHHLWIFVAYSDAEI